MNPHTLDLKPSEPRGRARSITTPVRSPSSASPTVSHVATSSQPLARSNDVSRNSGNKGPWHPTATRPDPENKELRRPLPVPSLPIESTITSPTDNSPVSNLLQEPASVKGTGDITVTSNLSVNAKEFVPKFRGSSHMEIKEFVPRNRAPPDEAVCLDGATYQPINQQFHDFEDLEVTPEEVAMNHLTEVMAHLTVNPGSFDTITVPLVDAFGSWLQDEDTILAVVAAMFEQSITQPNFRFNGARLCNLLNKTYSPTFRSYLLDRCRHEHTHMLATINSDPQRAHGCLLFLADLYITLEVVSGTKQKIAVLGQGVLQGLAALLRFSTQDNVKCVCQTLKLAGFHLNVLNKEDMDSIFKQLHSIHLDENTSSISQLLILNTKNLRKENWGISTPSQNETVTVAPSQAVPPENGPVFYGPDGEIMTSEENEFLQANISASVDGDEYDTAFREVAVWDEDEEMDEEIQAAFEQFLKLGRNSTTNTK